jgi:hypothetical protein
MTSINNSTSRPGIRGAISDFVSRMGIIGELMRFLWIRKLWWLIPMIVALLIVGVLIILGAVAPALSPFIYTLF